MDPTHPLDPAKMDASESVWIARLTIICLITGFTGLLMITVGMVGFLASLFRHKPNSKTELP